MFDFNPKIASKITFSPQLSHLFQNHDKYSYLCLIRYGKIPYSKLKHTKKGCRETAFSLSETRKIQEQCRQKQKESDKNQEQYEFPYPSEPFFVWYPGN